MAKRKQLPTGILGPNGYADTTHDRAAWHDELQKRQKERMYNNHLSHGTYRKETWMYVNTRRHEYTIQFVRVYADGYYETWYTEIFCVEWEAFWYYDMYSGNY